MINLRLFVLGTMLMLYGISAGAQTVTLPLREFVTKKYIHGVPYEDAKAYGRNVIPELTALLADVSYEVYRPNIVSVMGMIGDPSAVLPLKNYLYGQKGEISYSTFISVLAVFQALGYIAQSGDPDALQMLKNWSDPNYWNTAGLNFSYKSYKGPVMGEAISSLALQGLGISGREEALQHLEKVNSGASLAKRKPSFDSCVKSAIQLNKRVKTEGAVKVFGKTN